MAFKTELMAVRLPEPTDEVKFHYTMEGEWHPFYKVGDVVWLWRHIYVDPHDKEEEAEDDSDRGS